MRLPPLLLATLALTGLACRSPLADLKPGKGAPALNLAVRVEDHSRKLARLKEPEGEADTPAARQAALEAQRAAFEIEVRAKYIAWGILSGVVWGVGVGLLAHDARLAVGLGLYELLEESAFWIGGSMLMGRWSSPAVVEAQLTQTGSDTPSGRKRTTCCGPAGSWRPFRPRNRTGASASSRLPSARPWASCSTIWKPSPTSLGRSGFHRPCRNSRPHFRVPNIPPAGPRPEGKSQVGASRRQGL